jgi:hypothetical protein
MVFCSVSHASGDFGCDPPRGTLFFRGYQSCNSVLFLSPSNDSRLNLELLLIDEGKLTGAVVQDSNYPAMKDFVSLQVPFDFESWQLHEPGQGAANGGDAASANDYAEGEGSRCKNAKDGMEAFLKAVHAAAGLPAQEVAILDAARGAFTPECDAATHVAWKAPDGIHSALGQQFAAYIAGADAFYAGDFAAALQDFKSLKKSANPWLKETSSYMVGRTLLNSAQQHAFGEWGVLNVNGVNGDALDDAEDAFNEYLDDYANGMYAVSARGLLRRVYWLGGDQTKMAEAFDRAFADLENGSGNVTAEELVQEADAKLLSSVDIDKIESPRFLAMIDLMRMRSGTDIDGNPTDTPLLKLADLEAQKDRFASNPALYNYLLAAFHLYVDNKPEEALALVPALPATPLNYFAFSQQTLRVLALDATRQYDKERKLLLEMLPWARLPLESEQVQLELALVEENTGHLEQVFAPDSPIRDKAIRTILVEHTASAEMLRQRIKDPKENADVADAALYTLLYKELTGGKYQAFQADVALVPAHANELLAPFVAAGEGKGGGYECPAMRETAAALERDAGDARGLNCVGELVRLHSVHYGQDMTPQKTDLGGSGSLFPAASYSRMDGYLKVIAEKQADADARAYALYRAVHCYAPSGYNDCGSQNIPQSTRKLWFDTLHKEYPESAWAKSSKYYW